ncbi:MAG TPA: DHH family phosphoesterase, partial [Isosphaeraceae bacterium]|nr:DHH family phosphoesterase [Isosphaeraceae bacterium]
MAARWRLKPSEPEHVQTLSRESGLPGLVAQLLLLRGARTSAEARAFLEVRRDGLHDPQHLPGVIEAAERVVRAIQDHRKIVIYGDYDVDGVCGTSLLWACLQLAGAKQVEYYIPHRVDEGYGLNPEALRMLASDRGASLILTVDCGVSAVKEAELARSLGVELIVTDHHTPGPV